MLNGILCIDKPPGITSFDAVARMRRHARKAGTKKIGHGGTLDPMATGVLPLFFGHATKAVSFLPIQDKLYRATFRLGIVTDSQDITGTVVARQDVSAVRGDVERLLPRFTGAQKQVPPMYSAVQVDGKRLYDLARKGIEVERPAREIVIYSLTLVEADEASQEYTVDVACSKGTYIRTLCHDLGGALGCGATLTALRRTEACGFSLDRCVTLEQAAVLSDEGTLADRLIPVERVFDSLPKIVLNRPLSTYFCNGVPLWLSQLDKPGGIRPDIHAVYREDNVFLGLAQPDPDAGQLALRKLFAPSGNTATAGGEGL